MEVKIGVQHAARELTVDTDEEQDALEKRVAEALSTGGVLSLTDAKKRRVVVPADKITYIEMGGGVQGTVGFRS